MSTVKSDRPVLLDNLPLVDMTKEFVSTSGNGFSFYPYDNGAEALRLGFRSVKSSGKKAYIVTAGETGIELGSPHHTSMVTLLWTAKKGHIREGVHVSGRTFSEIDEPATSFLLTVMVEVLTGFDPRSTRFRTVLNLSNRIPGYMSRSIPGKLWVRISRDLKKNKFSPLSLGQSLIYAYHDAVPGIKAVEVLIAAGNILLTEQFEPVYNLERVYSGENSKLSLEASGIIECDDLSCSSCDEKKSCDIIREIMVIKKSKDKG